MTGFESSNRWSLITVRTLRELIVFAVFLLLAIVMTWPLATNLDRAVAGPSDPYLNAWILDWDFYAITHGRTLFDTNMFYPARDTLAFSENLLGIVLVVFPLQLAGVAPLTVHNVAMLLGFAFTGYGAFVLSRLVTRSPIAGMIGGIIFAFLPWRFGQLGHLQHMWAGWLPLLLAAMLYYARKPSWNRAWIFGAAFLINALTNLHWFAFGSLAIALSVPIAAIFANQPFERRFWLPIIVSTALSLALLTPVLLPYREASRLYGIRSDATETMNYSARPSDWLRTSPSHRVYGKLFSGADTDGEHWLFPGLLPVVLAGCALIFVRREDWEGTAAVRGPHRFPLAVILAVLWVALGFFGSLGLHFPFHRLLFEFVPLFRGIRVPARWAVISYTGLALLASVAVVPLMRGRGWINGAVGWLLVVAVAAEMHTAPIRWYTPPVTPRDVDRWLAAAPFAGAVLQLPLRQDDQYEYLLRSTTHHRRMINGVSGATPPAYDRLLTLQASDPIAPGFIDALDRLGVSLVVVHVDLLAERAPAVRDWLRQQIRGGRMTFVRHFNDTMQGDYVFALTRTEPEAAWMRAPEVADRAGRTPTDNLSIFLSNEGRSYCGATFGMIDSPAPGLRTKGPLTVGGWVLSPTGVGEVTVLLGNGRIRRPAERFLYQGIDNLFPWYPRTTLSGYRLTLDRRPDGLSADTDVQVEITDGSGKRTLLPDHWITWIRR
ncbi:MAG: hypothetical protein ABI718_14915 [Acidobacteriota bacterium]